MHFVVSWDIKVADQAKKDEIREAMKSALKGYSWVRPLEDFFIVKVGSQTEWDQIHTNLTETAKKHSAQVNFVMSPLMSGGRYNGWLPKDLWPKIRERATD